MNRILKSILFLGVLFCNSTSFSQALVINASAPCICDGGFTYSPEPGQPTFFELLNSNGTSLQTSGQANGTWSLNGLCEGIYRLTATTASDTYQDFIQINNAISPVATFGEASICSTAPNTNLSSFLTGFASGGIWTMPNGNFFNGIYNPSVHGSGFYTYTTNNGTCDQVTGVFVTEIQNANAGIQTTYLICDNYAAFNMIDFLEGNPDLGGQWLTAGGTPMNGVYDPATMSSGLFVYAIDNVPGCNAVFTTMFVDERITPNAGISSSLIVCNGAPAFNLFNQIPGNPMSGGFWFRPNGTPFNGVFNPAVDPAGNYRYVVTANAPCQDAESIITISFSNTDPSGISNQIEVCTSQPAFDMTSELNGFPINGGTWTNQQGQIVANNFNPAASNSGTFNYYFPNVGCSAQGAQLIINVLSAPNAGVDVLTELCSSNTPLNLNDLLQNETASGVFQNTLGQDISNLVNISSTQLFQARYIVTSTVCPSDTAQIIIGVVAPPVQPTSQVQEVCSNSGLINLNDYYQLVVFPQWQDLNGNQVPAQYNPIDGNTTLTIISLSQNACPNASATLEISVTDPAFNDALIQEVACTSDFPIDLNDYITAQAINLGAWTDATGNNISNTIIQLTQGNYVYNYTSSNNGPCDASQIILELQVFEAVEAGGDNSIVICESESNFNLENLLSSSAQPGGTWLNDGVPFAPQDYVLQGGAIDIIVYELAGNPGCAPDAAQFLIDVHSDVAADAGEDISICFGESDVQIGSQGQPNLNYSWIPSSFLSDPTNPSPIITLNGLPNQDQLLIFTLTVSDGVCTAQDEVEVTIYATPDVVIPSNIEICNGELVSYNIDPDLNCIWTPSNLFEDFTSNNPTITPVQDAIINLVIENQNGCQSNETSSIIVRPLPVIDFDLTPVSACSPLLIEQTWDSAAGLDYDIAWSSGNGDNDAGIDFLFNYTQPGVYSINLSVGNSFGCVSDTTYEDVIEVFPNPIADFSFSPNPPSIINNIVFFENSSSPAVSFEWTLDGQVLSSEENLTYEFPSDRAGDYTMCLHIINEYGCEASHCEYLEIKNDFTFYAPNAFTPDDDGLNDVFKPELIGFDFSTYSLKIFDRWGTLVFSTNDVDVPWVGDVRNGDYYAMQGVYNWIVEVKVDRLADFKTFKGSVLLVR